MVVGNGDCQCSACRIMRAATNEQVKLALINSTRECVRRWGVPDYLRTVTEILMAIGVVEEAHFVDTKISSEDLDGQPN